MPPVALVGWNEETIKRDMLGPYYNMIFSIEDLTL